MVAARKDGARIHVPALQGLDKSRFIEIGPNIQDVGAGVKVEVDLAGA